MKKEFDVAIIGGGLSGLMAARAILKNPNARVVVIDPGKSSKNNPTRLTFYDTIEKFDLLDSALERYKAFKMITPTGVESNHRFPHDVLVGLDYLHACNKVQAELVAFQHFEMIKNRVVSLNIVDDGVALKLRTGEELFSQLVIDASGKDHFLLNRIQNAPPKIQYSHSLGRMYENCAHEVVDECFFITGSSTYGSGGGWYYPIGDKKGSVGFAIVNHSSRFPGKQLKENFARAIENFHPFSTFLKNARVIKNESGTIPVEPLQKMHYDRILIVGDAAGQATPWMCMGVEPALLNGALAGEVARKAVENNEYSENYLYSYQQEWDREYRQAYSMITELPNNFWEMDDEVWDFLIKYDVAKLSPYKLLERMRSNKYTMSKSTAIMRWIRFKLGQKVRPASRI